MLCQDQAMDSWIGYLVRMFVTFEKMSPILCSAHGTGDRTSRSSCGSPLSGNIFVFIKLELLFDVFIHRDNNRALYYEVITDIFLKENEA